MPEGLLIGRDGELARIDAWLAARATAAGPPALLLGGEAGIGKTALLRAATATLPGGGGAATAGRAVVARAAASPWRTTPFGLLTQLPVKASTDPFPVRDDLLAAANGHPLVVLLDDLHWCDDATLQLLGPLIDALATDPVAIIGAYRSDELPRTHLLRPLRARLRQRGHLAEIALGPLTTEGVTALVTALLGRVPEPAAARAIGDRTEGVPFFVEELTAAIDSPGRTDGGRLPLPETIRDAVLLRASGLTEAARTALDAAAVMGLTFDVPAVCAVTGIPWPDDLDATGLILPAPNAPSIAGDDTGPDTLAGNADPALANGAAGWAAGAIGSGAGGDGRRFRHALTQEAIYGDVPWSRRRALHLAIAALVTDPATAAAHLLAGRDFAAALPALLAAAARHEDAYAYRDAARLLTEALEIWPASGDQERLAVLDRVARCAELSGDSTLAVTSLRELAAATPPEIDTPDAGTHEVAATALTEIDTQGAGARAGVFGAQVQGRLAVQYERLGYWAAALTAREAAAVAYAKRGLFDFAATERLAVAAHLRSAASFRAALEVLERAEADAVAAGRDDLSCRIAGLRGNVLARMGRAGEGVPAVRKALGAALRLGLQVTAAEIYQRLADSLEHSGDYRAAGRAYESAYEFCATNDLTAVGQLCQACATVVMFHRGRWDRAVELCTGVLGEDGAAPHARTVAAGVLGLILVLRGGNAAGREALLESRTRAVAIDLVAMEILATWGLALADEADGRPDLATEGYRQVLTRCRETEESHYCVPVLQFAAARFTDRADLGAATALLGEIVARTGQPEAESAFAYALAECAAHDDGPAAAEPHLRRSLELLEGLHLPLADLLIRLRLGDSEAAYRTARRLKMRLLVEPRTKSPGSLTEREVQVLDLVADGLTNREIGARLFLSVRTVEMHVRNAVAKLGCRTRAEAAVLLRRGGSSA